MLEPHPPHHTPNTWRDFFIHIATIVVGLLIAVGLEQTVEAIHHRHQLHVLEEQMHTTLESNRQLSAYDLQRLTALRGYLSDLRLAVAARRAGKPLGTEPPLSDPRTLGVLRLPSLAPYEAAKQNGTAALLSGDELRIYNRVFLQRELMMQATQEWFHALSALESFDERYTDFPGSLIMGETVIAPRLDTLSPEDLTENQTLVANLIKQSDVLAERFTHFDRQCEVILKGVKDELQLLNAFTGDAAGQPHSNAVPSPQGR